MVFIAAGIYNIVWGLYAIYDPQWLFRFSGLPPLNHPAIFACLGMVVGLYGIIYFEVARIPERGWLLAAVGLLGKILGPLGFVFGASTGELPWAFGWVNVFNDLIWLPAFTLFAIAVWKNEKAKSRHTV